MKIIARHLLIFLMTVASVGTASAQRNIYEVELELRDHAEVLLGTADLRQKVQDNKAFSSLLFETLKRPDSYDFPFDSLKSVSILRAEDDAFRIFTWQISHRADTNQRSYYGNISHYYFGMVQRKIEIGKDSFRTVVIPLIELNEIPSGVENLVLDNQSWLGGLYYQPKFHEGIPKMKFKYFDPTDRKSNGKLKKKKLHYYLLFGWNGMDNRSNIKFLDVMTFDPKDEERVIFGANVFYFDVLPKFRALFKYSEYAPFSLNYSYVQAGSKRKLMIVYDHLATPKMQEKKLEEITELGPDGSYDALGYNKRSGVIEWFSNVELAEEFNSKLNRQRIEEQRELFEKQRQAEIDRLKAAGIQLQPPQESEEDDGQ
ncbi:hypothetical protein [Pontibacter sp. G13]|uniref:hypothetical protein n=1 Tax=Pontibacter sp. G13 TaxID=3074898 RepID=UPI00288A6584|nr:hypothetical protein [Pontibacter sp. G13]WNJ18587.1 hypothetical protein RJD25_27340 [Pontibacter sp. G13]